MKNRTVMFIAIFLAIVLTLLLIWFMPYGREGHGMQEIPQQNQKAQ